MSKSLIKEAFKPHVQSMELIVNYFHENDNLCNTISEAGATRIRELNQPYYEKALELLFYFRKLSDEDLNG